MGCYSCLIGTVKSVCKKKKKWFVPPVCRVSRLNQRLLRPFIFFFLFAYICIIFIPREIDLYQSADVLPPVYPYVAYNLASSSWSRGIYDPPPQANYPSTSHHFPLPSLFNVTSLRDVIPSRDVIPPRMFFLDRLQLSESLGIPVTSLVTLPDSLDDFVIVTAADLRYAYVAMDAIGTVQRYLPNRKIIFYDLGILDEETESLIQRLCDVEYRKMDFSRYPSHVSNLRTYAWKPLIIHEVLRQYSGVFWIDSSIRFHSKSTKLFSNVLEDVVRSGGILSILSSGHSNYAVTHPDMFGFLRTRTDEMVRTDQKESGCLIVYRTQPIYDWMVRWWVLCALQAECIAPTLNRGCKNVYASRSVYAMCHRFDQSAINILMANWFSYDEQQYYAKPMTGSSVRLVKVNRYSLGKHKIKFHSRGGSQTDCPAVKPAFPPKIAESRELKEKNDDYKEG